MIFAVNFNFQFSISIFYFYIFIIEQMILFIFCVLKHPLHHYIITKLKVSYLQTKIV